VLSGGSLSRGSAAAHQLRPGAASGAARGLGVESGGWRGCGVFTRAGQTAKRKKEAQRRVAAERQGTRRMLKAVARVGAAGEGIARSGG